MEEFDTLDLQEAEALLESFPNRAETIPNHALTHRGYAEAMR